MKTVAVSVCFLEQYTSPKAGIQSIKNSICIPWPLIA